MKKHLTKFYAPTDLAIIGFGVVITALGKNVIRYGLNELRKDWNR